MHVAVLGAGTMGHGIAQVAAMAGHDVTIRDVDDDRVADGLDAIETNLQGALERDKTTDAEVAETLEHLSGTTSLEGAVSETDIAIEAVPEDIDLKQEVFSKLEIHAPTDAVIATNTSSLSITRIASVLDDPSRSIGLHFFNPVHIMPIVEVIHGERTTTETREFVVDFVDGIDREFVEVTDSPGFASSRLGVSLGVEAMRMVQDGTAAPRDIDAVMESGYNHAMGPIELSDVVGLDVRLHILEHLHAELGERFRPPTVLRRKVDAGMLGKKTGEGFYVWEDGEIVESAVSGGR